MEFEQLVKRIEWMDEENRKTTAAITRLEERMAALEANIDTVAKQLKPLPKQIADIASTAARLDQFDGGPAGTGTAARPGRPATGRRAP